MRKKFAEDDLLGKFRLKSNASLRIDLKPTPPEQVEEVIKKMEPVIETLGTPEQSQSSLSIDWNTNEIEVPDNMPSDEELKAILFRDPNEEVPPDQLDLLKSQRHQKMLELLAKVEALTQKPTEEMTQFDETLSELPVVPASEALLISEMDSSLINGEEAGMRSDTEQFQTVQGKQTAAELKAAETGIQVTPTLEKGFKLDVDHEDFQDRLIRILNENYSDMGEIRPHNLKSRLIEILNEEYAEDYLEQDDFEENNLKENNLEEDNVDQPEMVLQGMRDPSGFLSEDYNHNSPDLKPIWENTEKITETHPSDYPPVRRNRERFSNFQYVTSFQEVTEPETEPEENPEIVEDGDSSEAVSPQKAEDEEISPKSDFTPNPETSQLSDRSYLNSDLHNMKPSDEIRTDEQRWLKELREEGGNEGSFPEVSEPQPELEHKWAPAEVFGAVEKESDRPAFQERALNRDHRHEEEQGFKAERRFGVEAAETAKSEGIPTEKNVAQNTDRTMSVEEWSFVFDTLKEQIDYLRKQLEIKDHQLQNKDELIRNFQILLKNEQDKFLKLENKMEDVVLQVEERAAKKGFFSRFRKR